MKKINILKNNRDFNRIINNTKPIKSNNFIIYVEKVNEPSYHFGFSVGKKIGTAVMRNRIKRQLKSIIDKKKYINGFNCIVIAKKKVLSLTYNEMKDELLKILENIKIIEGEK